MTNKNEKSSMQKNKKEYCGASAGAEYVDNK